jgi:hypothetical protein
METAVAANRHAEIGRGFLSRHSSLLLNPVERQVEN